jgi:hypothetical protein
MKLTPKQINALKAARDKGGAQYLPNDGGGRFAMFKRLAAAGLIEPIAPFPITPEGAAELVLIEEEKLAKDYRRGAPWAVKKMKIRLTNLMIWGGFKTTEIAA